MFMYKTWASMAEKGGGGEGKVVWEWWNRSFVKFMSWQRRPEYTMEQRQPLK